MINKTNILKLINEKFPELERVSFSLNGRIINDFSQKTLFPFMIYQNTVNTLNRLITIYLPENSNSSLLTPFISVVGAYRKGLELLMQEKKYINEIFPNQEKQVVYNGDVCSIIRINYINRLLTLMGGMGHIHEIPFNSSSRLKWSYSNASDIYSRIEEFKKNDKLKKKDIFTFPLVPKHFSGVMFFTNISKFESLLRTIKISDSDIRQHLKILKTTFPNNGESIDFHELSLNATKNKPASIIVSRTDSYKAFHNIIDAGNGSCNHIDTIIIDDFDDIIYKAKKNNTLGEDLEFFKNNYINELGKGIKNIFLICSNRNFDIERILKSNNINSYPWLLMPLEKITLDEYKTYKPEIFVSCIDDSSFEEILWKIGNLLLKWKELAKTNFCNGQILRPVRNLISLREKWISFYDPICFQNFLLDFIYFLNQLKEEWFYNELDYGLIDETISFCDFIKDKFKRCLLEDEIISLLKKSDEKLKQVEIVSRNVDESDKEYFLRYLEKINSEIEFEIKNTNESLLGNTSTINKPDLIIYLTWNRELLNSSMINPIAKQQVYLINHMGYQYLKLNYTLINKRIKNIGNTGNKYRLLNIEVDKEMTSSDEELISVSFGPCKIEKEDNQVIDVIPGVEGFVHDIIKEHLNSNRPPNLVTNDYMIFFDDGSHIDWPEHKKVFCYDENTESENISIQKDIYELKVGDQIIISKRSRELRKVIDETLSKDEYYHESIKSDHDWRDKILDHIKHNKWDLQYFRKKLSENGFKVETDFTITNWIEGETIKPNNFRKLLNSLVQMDILSEGKIKEYNKQTTDLKSIKTKLIRSSAQKLFLSLKGINYGKDDFFKEELLDAFLEHIEIKRVFGIIKK